MIKEGPIPIVEVYRGVGLHDQQDADRLKIVRAAIDVVTAMSNILDLVDFAADRMQPPEARLFAASKVESLYELAAERRENRPKVDLLWLGAVTAGLDSEGWRSPWLYGALPDREGVPREVVLKDDR